MFKRKPPYCDAVKAALEAERPVLGGAVLIAAGAKPWDLLRAWRALEPAPPALCVPPGEAPQLFDWSLVRGHEVWLYSGDDMDDAACEALARCLLFAGAKRVEAVFSERETLAFLPSRKAA